MKQKNSVNILTVSFFIFLSFIILFFSVGFYLFNSITIKDLKISNTVFASTDITFEKLGFSDMTLAEFLSTIQNFASPDEHKILNNTPSKKDKDILTKVLNLIGLTEDNMSDILTNGEDYKTSENLILSDREICLLMDSIIKDCNYEEYNSIINLCGKESVSVKNVYFYYSEDGEKLFMDISISVDISNIRDKILENFGQPIFQICNSLYFVGTYEINIVDNKLNGQCQTVTLNNMDEELSKKMMYALFISYNLEDTLENHIFSYENLSEEVLNLFTISLNNLGNSSFAVYEKSDTNEDERTDLKEDEIYLIIQN